MKKFALTAMVSRVVTDRTNLHVEADSIEDAYEKALTVLAVYPRPHAEKGVPYVYVEERNIDHTEVRWLSEEEDIGIA